MSRTLPVHSVRFLSSTTPRRAVEKPPSLDKPSLDALKATSTYQKLSKNPDAILAIKNFAEIMEKQGVDTTSGKPPSMLQMSKLFLNSEVREASKKLVEELKKAGVDLSSKVRIFCAV
ncbi:hypothetical protein BDZ97DRAFT_1647253 [Flammula alnicola]|nr:hypothetical protein BDZ97DRAFT_1647253 [Flammula alnicola]